MPPTSVNFDGVVEELEDGAAEAAGVAVAGQGTARELLEEGDLPLGEEVGLRGERAADGVEEVVLAVEEAHLPGLEVPSRR